MPGSGWDLHRSEIERLYVQESKTRAEVMALMSTNYSWNKSGAQYSKKFKEWGLKKNSNSIENQWIARKVDKRKREDGKESEIFINGIQLHPSKVIKSSYRKGYLTEYARHGPPPSTPEGYSVATPTTSGCQISWKTPLPWMGFMRLLQAPHNDDYSASSSVSSLILNPSRCVNGVGLDKNLWLMKSLTGIIPWNKLSHPKGLHSASRVSAALSILMPESEPGQHDVLSTDMSTASASVLEHVSVLLYLLSNHLTQWDFESVAEPDGPALERNDELLLRILKDTGWNDLTYLQVLLSSREPTAECITERLFAAALRQGSFDIVQKLLLSGMVPPISIECRRVMGNDSLTPLQFLCATGRTADLIDLLISHGADVNFSTGNDGRTALYYALAAQNEPATRILLGHRAEVTWQCAREAIWARRHCPPILSLLDDIINIYLDQDVRRKRDDAETLRLAVQRGDLQIINRFLEKSIDLSGLIDFHHFWNGLVYTRNPGSTSRGFTTLLGVAAYCDKIQVVQLLLRAGIHEYPDCPSYISPLALAVHSGSFAITKIFLSSGVDIRCADDGAPTLLELACSGQTPSVALCEVLINHGAKIDRQPLSAHHRPSALMIAVQRKLVGIVDLLVRSDARLDDVFKTDPESILAAALQAREKKIIDRLVKAGATIVGTSISRIDDLQNAAFLQDIGILPNHFLDCGPKLLAAAISERDDPLAWFLLEKNAHMGRTEPWKTPLCAALQVGNLNLAWALLERGAEITACALTDALKVGSLNFTLALLARGVEVTDHALTEAIARDRDLLPELLLAFTGSAPTAVSAAVLKGSTADLELLRAANVDFMGVPRVWVHGWNGADVNGLPSSGIQSVLELAGWKASTCTFKYLLEWVSSARMDWSPIHVARALAIAIFHQRHEHVKELMRLESGLNCDMDMYYLSPFYEFCHGQCPIFSPLQAAVKTQQVSVVRQLLVSKGADVNYLGSGKLRRTALQHAVELGNMEIINLLLDRGADVNGPPAIDGGATALQIAAIKGYIGIARRLLDLGADVNQAPAPENGRTALMGAAEYGRIDMLQMLFDEGALVVGEYEGYYHEAVKLAEGQCHYAAARLLKSFKESVESCSP